MKYTEFLDAVIESGIAAARRDYLTDPAKMEGAVAGFEACRGLHPGDLALLLASAQERVRKAWNERQLHKHNYWWARCYELEVAWVCNVVGAAFTVVETRRMLELPTPFVEWRDTPVPITGRGALHAATILGVREVA